GEGRRAGEGVAAVAVAVEEGPLLLAGSEEGGEDALGRQGRGEGQVASGEPLGEAEEIGDDILVLAGEEPAGASEPGHDLAADENGPGPGARVAKPAQRARRPKPHPRRALDEGFEAHRVDLAGGRRVEGFQLLDSRKSAHRIADGPVQAVKDGNAPE